MFFYVYICLLVLFITLRTNLMGFGMNSKSRKRYRLCSIRNTFGIMKVGLWSLTITYAFEFSCPIAKMTIITHYLNSQITNHPRHILVISYNPILISNLHCFSRSITYSLINLYSFCLCDFYQLKNPFPIINQLPH